MEEIRLKKLYKVAYLLFGFIAIMLNSLLLQKLLRINSWRISIT